MKTRRKMKGGKDKESAASSRLPSGAMTPYGQIPLQQQQINEQQNLEQVLLEQQLAAAAQLVAESGPAQRQAERIENTVRRYHRMHNDDRPPGAIIADIAPEELESEYTFFGKDPRVNDTHDWEWVFEREVPNIEGQNNDTHWTLVKSRNGDLEYVLFGEDSGPLIQISDQNYRAFIQHVSTKTGVNNLNQLNLQQQQQAIDEIFYSLLINQNILSELGTFRFPGWSNQQQPQPHQQHQGETKTEGEAKTGGGVKKRKQKGGHHLYKRLGVSKYASQKQIRKAFKTLKKKRKATKKVKEAYKILSRKKTRKQYNNRYRKMKRNK